MDAIDNESPAPSLFAGRVLSRLMLGTVQLGMPYGIANRTGQPDFALVKAILAAAADAGVNGLDTAALYGESEAILGQALAELGLTDRMAVVTKVVHLRPDRYPDERSIRAAIVESVENSLRRLRLDCLAGVLFHREEDAAWLPVLLELKAQGKLRHAGVSCGNLPEGPARLIETGQAEALQLPANILDRRHERAGNFREAARRGVAILIRSIYLQGLLVMPEPEIPAHLRPVIPARRRFDVLACAAGLPLGELALRYMLGLEGVTSILTGVETLAQLHANLAMFQRGPLPPDLHAVAHAALPDLPDDLITPPAWPALAAAEKSAPA